ncbi:uncharacterized protein LOC113771443 [Coffea eugenioides]|uniref:uncharacterized protein LOC113771443 n=1 Tax=Coffea eugenioides TaxID=49369 RepID=UPI000F609A0B|nr:uncharacterized protein LOC113771443 [Coffea eugenioides]
MAVTFAEISRGLSSSKKTSRRTRKETRQLREEHSSAASQRPESEVESTDSFGDTSSDSDQEEGTIANAQTLRELATPDLTQQPLCITFPKFDVVCNSMKPTGITEEQIKMRAFPFSLKDSAKDWLAASLRKEICGIKQHPGESLYEYWERFKKLCNKCPQHQISEQLLIQYFYEGLLFRDRSIIDVASGGALVNKTPREARELIEGMAENSQQFGTREDVPIRKVNEVETSSIQQQLSELTSFVRQLTVGNALQAKVCGVCTGMGHSADMCPMIQEETAEQQGYQQQYQPRQPPPPPNSSPSMEEMMKQLLANQQKTDSDLQIMRNQLGQVPSLQNQVNQMVITINRLEFQIQGKLSSQPELNPKNVSAMTLRSGKEVRGPEPVTPKDKDEKKNRKGV